MLRPQSLLPLALFTCALGPWTTPAAADGVVPGFELNELAMPGAGLFGTVSCTLANGDLVTYDGSSVDRWTAAGAFLQNLGTVTPPGYPAFVLAEPGGAAVVLAHSGDFLAQVPGAVLRAALDGTGVTPVVALEYAYDAVFLPGGELLVTAGRNTPSQQDHFVRVDVGAGTLQEIGSVNGASGSLALRGGDLYYATAESDFPAAPGSAEIVYWTAAQVAAGSLSEANWTLWASGYDPITSLRVDPVRQRVYVAENVFDASGTLLSSKVRWARKKSANAKLVADPDHAVSALQFVNTLGGAANFQAFQPGDGWHLQYDQTDFSSVTERVDVGPKRPTVTASGPGLVGLGSVTLTAVDAPANGVIYLGFGLQATMSPTEQAYVHPGYLFHTTLAPGSIKRLPFLIPTDATGTGSFTLYNDGSLTGLYGYQYLVGDGAATFVGATDVVTF